MRALSDDLAQHLASELTTLAMCWKLTPVGGEAMGFTDHDRDVVVDGVAYSAATGFTPTAISSNGDLAVANLDVEGVLDAAMLTEEDILAGKYDHAEIEVFWVNYEDISQGVMMLRKGWLGEITLQGGRFHAEVRGVTQPLAQSVGSFFSPTCRAALGDARCSVSMEAYTHTGTVTGVTSRQVVVDAARSEEDGYFTYGALTFTSGANIGLSMEVKEYRGKQVTLVMPMPYTVEVGDAYSLRAGCDKTIATCNGVFANIANFRGEPHVPGTDRMFETSSTRSEW